MRVYWRGPRVVTAALIMGAVAMAAQASTPTQSTDPSTLARTLQSRNPGDAAAAAYWLGLKGAAAIPEIPRLVAALGDDRPVNPAVYRNDSKSKARSTPGEEAAEALVRIGKPSVDQLILALRGSNSAVARRNAAWALGQIDTASHDSTSAATPPRRTGQQL